MLEFKEIKHRSKISSWDYNIITESYSPLEVTLRYFKNLNPFHIRKLEKLSFINKLLEKFWMQRHPY